MEEDPSNEDQNNDTALPDPEDQLEITLEDLEETPADCGPLETLELTLEDLQQEQTSAPDELPALDAADAAVAGSSLPWVEIGAMCGSQQKPFAVRFQEQSPGSYQLVAATVVDSQGKEALPVGPQTTLSHLQGQFSTRGYTGCPACGAPGLIQCDRCEVVMCGSALVEDKRGVYCLCPNCGGKGRVETPKQVSVRGQTGGLKGGKGAKGKGLF